jgi:glycosyltransferase involved in cell wall biosynthesis
MKILQLGKFYPVYGGVEKVMYDLTLGLSERQVYCDMLCAAEEGMQPGIIRLNRYARLIGVRTWKKAAGTMIAPGMISTLRQIKDAYDIIHIHHPDPMACMALFLSGYRGKVVLHWHSDILKQKMILKFYAPLQRWLIRRADAVVGTTPVYVKESPFLRKVQDKTLSVPIGVEPVAADKRLAEQIKARFPGRKIVFALGRLVGYKGFEYLVRAARFLEEDVMVVIGGNGPLRGSLTALADDLGVSGRVKLIGRVPDEELPAWYAACDLFCLSSVWKTEAFAIAQVEAMSYGKPVVATRIPGSGVSWVNAGGVSGLNVAPGDPESLACAVNAVLSDEELYARLAEGAARRFRAEFTRDRMIARCVEIYNRILAVGRVEGLSAAGRQEVLTGEMQGYKSGVVV